MKNLSLLPGYLFLLAAIITGIVANGYLKTTEGFTKLNPTIFCIISIVICIFCISCVFHLHFPPSQLSIFAKYVFCVFWGTFMCIFTVIPIAVEFVKLHQNPHKIHIKYRFAKKMTVS